MKRKINLKDFNLSTNKLITIEKAASHINDKGELIKDKYYSIGNRPEIYLSDDMERKKKRKKSKAKRKTKGCGCK
jgi:hypothetical protein